MQQLSYDGVYPCAKTSLQCTHARAAKTCHRVLTLGRIGMDAQIIVLDAIWTKAASKGQSVGSLNASACQSLAKRERTSRRTRCAWDSRENIRNKLASYADLKLRLTDRQSDSLSHFNNGVEFKTTIVVEMYSS